MKKVSRVKFFVFYASFSCFSNVVHPITPTMFQNNGFPDYMFGVSFAAMAFAMFLSSPYWGKLGDKIGHAKVLAFSLPFYAVSQMLFGVANTPMLATIARLLCGFFSGGTVVGFMAYIVNTTTDQDRGRIMSYYAATNSVFAAFGYSVGGILGSISMSAVFSIQFIMLVATGIFVHFMLKDPNREEMKYTYNSSVNPLRAFVDMKDILTASIVTFLVVVFLTSFATTAYDNAFNYYLKAAMDLPSSYNGIIKAVIGIVALVVNFTINIYIANKTDMRKSIIWVLALCGLSAMVVPFIPGTAMFFGGNIIFFMFNSMYIPIQQVLVTKDSDSKSSGIISGVFNSVKSVGMIFGALFAGFIYSWGSILPFLTAAVAFILGAIISYVNYKQCKSK